MSGDWDPAQYRRFAAERAQPFHDLLDLVEQVVSRPVGRGVDLGCGSGELTVLAAERLEVGEMVGIDSSPAMLAAAPRLAGPGLRFELGDLATWTSSGDHGLVLANASLQWVPDHPAVLARWFDALADDGVLAVQVPSNADHASHRTIDEVAATEPFASAFGGAPPVDPVASNVLAPETYAEVLHDLGGRDVHVRLQVYGHVLASTADVVEWTRGTSLTRVFARLPGELHEPFVEAYRQRLLAELGERARYFYAFKRVLLRARR